MVAELNFEEDEAYELYAGCPTLSFRIEDREESVPYSSFNKGLYELGEIRLKFDKGSLVIRGKNLRDLWRHLQLQDVRFVKCNDADPSQDVLISSIAWFSAKAS
ncbi:MAG: hypothetical protein ACPGN3_11820 [Opitutales bacterium]